MGLSNLSEGRKSLIVSFSLHISNSFFYYYTRCVFHFALNVYDRLNGGPSDKITKKFEAHCKGGQFATLHRQWDHLMKYALTERKYHTDRMWFLLLI